MNDYRPERDAAKDAADLATTDDRLARCKRASLGCQALRTAWDLGALVRRVEREAPELRPKLHEAVEALQLLGEQLAEQHESDRPSRPTGESSATNATLPDDSPRQGELF